MQGIFGLLLFCILDMDDLAEKLKLEAKKEYNRNCNEVNLENIKVAFLTWLGSAPVKLTRELQ
jgi:hypothetical protein